MNELINLRKEREKHFLNEDGTITAQIYNEDIHYLKNGKYQEIDNTFIEKNNFITNKDNDFKIYLSKDKYFININIDNHYMNIILKDHFDKLNPEYTSNEVIYKEALPNIDFIYKMIGKELKEVILLKAIPQDKITFLIDTNLKLELLEDKVVAKSNNEVIYQFLPLFMKDNNDNYYYNCKYNLNKCDVGYELELILDNEWLGKATYPVIVDPTIKVNSDDDIQDVYIYPGDSSVDRNSQDVLKLGVDSNNVVYRVLTKFKLPEIGTSSSIISAFASYVTHKDEEYSYYMPTDYIGVYALNCDWNEQTANWEQMNNKYESYCQEYNGFKRTKTEVDGNNINVNLETNSIEITNLVKEWYLNKPNYGMMLKLIKEEYDSNLPMHMFYSKNNNMIDSLGSNPKPYLTLTYRSRNGNYSNMSSLSNELSLGSSIINTLTGNLLNSIAINRTTNSKLTIDLVVNYNTNDVVESDDGIYLAKGWRFNYDQYITKQKIGETEYLKYVDGSGHSLFFYKNNGDYFSEDGLSINITVNEENITIKDEENRMIFKKYESKYILVEINNIRDESIKIERLANGNIKELIDSNEKKVTFNYVSNSITVNSDYMDTIITIDDGLLSKIESKFGILKIKYNTNSLVEKIIDADNQYIHYDYYDNYPYRIKKSTRYGTNGTEGTSEEFKYDFLTTTIKNSQGQKVSYTFNKSDNLVGVLYYDKTGNLKNCSGYNNFFQQFVNKKDESGNTYFEKIEKLTSSSITVKPIDNLMSNQYFYDRVKSNPNINRLDAADPLDFLFEINGNIEENIYEVSEDNYYTFSIDIKKQYDTDTKLILKNDEKETATKVVENEDFTRYSVTEHYAQGDQITLKIETESNIEITNIQLELGAVSNKYNMIQNPSFKEGTTGWIVLAQPISESDASMFSHSVETVDEFNNAYHFSNSPEVSYTINQPFMVSGKKGDAYNLSFLYKNTGLHESTEYDFGIAGTKTSIRFLPSEFIGEEIETYELNKHNEWGIFNKTFIAPYDYNMIVFEIDSVAEVNDLYLTNFSLVKDLNSMYLKYDEDGKLLEFSDYNTDNTKIEYNEDNQISSIIYAGYKSFECEYDKKNKKKLINLLNVDGIKQNIKYDSNGKINGTIISNIKNKENYNNVNIRSKGSNKYLTPNHVSRKIDLKEAICNISVFNLIKNGENYNISPNLLPDFYLDMYREMVIIKKTDMPLSFELIEHKDYSFSIKELSTNKYLCVVDDKIQLKEYEKGNKNYDFYLEFYENNNKFMSNSYIYNEENKEYTDTLGNIVKYEVDEITNLLKSSIDPEGVKTSYEYDEMNRLTKMKKEGKEVTYTYSDSNRVSTIKSGTKEYKFIFDEFLNITGIMLNNQILTSYEYDSKSGILQKLVYANGDSVEYKYDDSLRISEIISIDADGTKHNINYYYDNFNNVNKIITDERTYETDYDLIKKIAKYNVDNSFFCKYRYSSDNEVSSINYTYNNQSNDISFERTKGGNLLKTSMKENNTLDGEISYEYDELGRLKVKKINDHIIYEQEFYCNGNRTSSLIKNIKFNEDNYTYEYNVSNYIRKIYHNDNVIKEYKYDNFKRIAQEIDYIHYVKIVYTYDLEGNIKEVKKFNTTNEELIKKDVFEYTNQLWEDQLIKFNDIAISYDTMGNPIKIGDSILIWNQGRRLSSYRENDLDVKYKYDINGLRSKKKVGNKTYTYYYQNGNLIVEDIDGIVIKYLYDENSGLIAFTYQNNIYYYNKNIQGDIIEILDNNLNKIVEYKYDTWGVIESVIDNSDNNIGRINPFRYRGYYYDEETKLYYIKSRYYNPEWRRFINADGIINAERTIDGYNLYTYVGNNPVNKFDFNGCLSLIVSYFLGKLLEKPIKKLVNKINKIKDDVITAVQTNVEKIITGGKAPKKTTKKSAKAVINLGGNKSIEGEVTIVESVSRESAPIDLGYEFINHDTLNVVMDVQNLSFSVGDDGLGTTAKISTDNGYNIIAGVSFDGKSRIDLFNAIYSPLGKIKVTSGIETISQDNKPVTILFSYEMDALELALALALARVNVAEQIPVGSEESTYYSPIGGIPDFSIVIPSNGGFQTVPVY